MRAKVYCAQHSIWALRCMSRCFRSGGQSDTKPPMDFWTRAHYSTTPALGLRLLPQSVAAALSELENPVQIFMC
ncbi:hypothetical protein TNCV_229361 [Trichonephila clavipes]|nr:hypothetical protein TNCV_229361 [Trichonephila clavipes]